MNSIERRNERYKRRKAAREKKKQLNDEQHGNYEQVFTFDHLYKSYKKCCSGVGWKSSTQRYKTNALYNVVDTYNALMACTYKSRGFYEFDIVERGKPRHIQSVHISERVVQRCLCDYSLVPTFSRSFIYDNGACMKNKGIDFAIHRITCHLRRFYREYKDDGYVLLFDFSKYFDNIQHQPLIEIVKDRYSDERMQNLIIAFITAFGEKGLGLGSQISQISALMFPNALDHFIKEKLRIKYYGRYMDDGYLIHHDKAYLVECRKRIIELCHSLGIVMNVKKTQIVKLSRGFTFLKTKFSYSSTGRIIKKPARKGITGMRRKLKKFRRWVDEGRMTFDDVNTSYQSWRGHLKKCNSYRTLKRMDKLFKKLFKEELSNERTGNSP